MLLYISTFLPHVLAMENPFAKFGVNSWQALVANAVAFILAAIILKVFALKPIQKMLEERKQRIQEGEEMRSKSESMLNEMEQRTKDILNKAHEESSQVIENARETADKHIEQKKQEAVRMVEDILAKSREAAELESQQARNALRTEFTRLITQTTSQVTGKVLTEEDKRVIDQSTIDAIKE